MALKWPFMCWCAVKKLLAHLSSHSIVVRLRGTRPTLVLPQYCVFCCNVSATAIDRISACKKLCCTSSLTGNGDVQTIFVLSVIVANTFCPLNSQCPVKVMELPSLTFFYLCSRRRYDDCHGLVVNITQSVLHILRWHGKSSCWCILDQLNKFVYLSLLAVMS